MFGKLGKQFAGQISEKIEGAVGAHLTSKDNGNRTEKATDALSKVHGRRKALFVGINYKGQRGELRGCINDVNNIKGFLTQNYGIDEVLVLTDVSWLIHDPLPGFVFVLFFLGRLYCLSASPQNFQLPFSPPSLRYLTLFLNFILPSLHVVPCTSGPVGSEEAADPGQHPGWIPVAPGWRQGRRLPHLPL